MAASTISGEPPFSTKLLAQGQSSAAALSGGYHLAWAIGAGLVVATIVLAATVLTPETAVEADSGLEEEEEEASA